MSHISFQQGAVIPSSWLNDVDTVTYTYFGNGTSLTGNLKVPVNSSVGNNIPGGTGARTWWIDNNGGAGNITRLRSLGQDAATLGTFNFEVAKSDNTGIVNPVSINSSGVVTPQVGTITAVDLTFQAGNSIFWKIGNSSSHFTPILDNQSDIGQPATRVRNVFTPIIDSGTTGSLSLKTNNGTTQVTVSHTANAVNRIEFTGAATGGKVTTSAFGSDTNIGWQLTSAGTGGYDFYTGSANSTTAGAILQFQVQHTAGATRNITVTGSNGGNPTIAATAGSPAIVFASAGGTGTPSGHTLSMYEEGGVTGFIPSLGGTTTYNQQTGWYVKIGQIVHFSLRLVVNTIGTGSSTTISGLPFAHTSLTLSDTAVCASNTSSLASTVVSISPHISAGSTIIVCLSRTAAAASDSLNALFQNGSTITVSGTYKTD